VDRRLAIGGALANEVHRYAHQPSAAPGWVRVLQEIGLCQSPKEHSAHHRPPHDANFCILTDWLNPLLEAIRLLDGAWAPAAEGRLMQVGARSSARRGVVGKRRVISAGRSATRSSLVR
jgi:hypothetical protein